MNVTSISLELTISTPSESRQNVDLALRSHRGEHPQRSRDAIDGKSQAWGNTVSATLVAAESCGHARVGSIQGRDNLPEILAGNVHLGLTLGEISHLWWNEDARHQWP